MVNLSSTPLLHSPCDMWVTFYMILHCSWRTAGIRQYLNHIAGRFHPGNGAADSAVLTLPPAWRRLLLLPPALLLRGYLKFPGERVALIQCDTQLISSAIAAWLETVKVCCQLQSTFQTSSMAVAHYCHCEANIECRCNMCPATCLCGWVNQTCRAPLGRDSEASSSQPTFQAPNLSLMCCQDFYRTLLGTFPADFQPPAGQGAIEA